VDLDYWPSCFLYKTDIDATLSGQIAKVPTTLIKKLTSISQMYPRVPQYTNVLSLCPCVFSLPKTSLKLTHIFSAHA
jgi:hypothetical protein